MIFWRIQTESILCCCRNSALVNSAADGGGSMTLSFGLIHQPLIRHCFSASLGPYSGFACVVSPRKLWDRWSPVRPRLREKPERTDNRFVSKKRADQWSEILTKSGRKGVPVWDKGGCQRGRGYETLKYISVHRALSALLRKSDTTLYHSVEWLKKKNKQLFNHNSF